MTTPADINEKSGAGWRILTVLLIALLVYVVYTEREDKLHFMEEIQQFNSRIDSLSSSIDQYELQVEGYESNVAQLEKSLASTKQQLRDVRKDYQRQAAAVDTFDRHQLEEFFANRYHH